MTASWREELKALLPGVLLDEPLSRHTSFRIGGPADAYFEAASRNELIRLARFARSRSVPLTPLGWGSNVLVQDGGVRGVVLRLRGDFEKVEFLDDGLVRAGAGVRVPQWVALCAERGLSGGEALVGVPGTIGGALVMNAGTRDGEIGALVREVEVFDWDRQAPEAVPAERLRFRYRSSGLEGRLVLSGLLRLKADDKVVIMRRVQEFQRRRLQTQPIHTYNVGSTFKNPPGRYAARLIEDAGLKGTERGGARISPMHANFIENFRGASAADVLALVELARERVRSVAGVDLELEMRVIGDA